MPRGDGKDKQGELIFVGATCVLFPGGMETRGQVRNEPINERREDFEPLKDVQDPIEGEGQQESPQERPLWTANEIMRKRRGTNT